jgi:threonine/homoserine/homoserine lactone efflux protein
VIPLDTWLLFFAACVVLVATPGPTVLYLVSRTLVQGRVAGFVSLVGTSVGFLFHVLAAALGLSAILAAVPMAYDAIRVAGAIYLAWLAWSTWRAPDLVPVAGSTPAAPRARLFRDGVVTAVLNPKVAMFQLALFPQFVDPAQGSVLAQSAVLGMTQVAVQVVGDSIFVLAASGMRAFLVGRPSWATWSKRVLAGVFAALAARLALDARHAP